MVVKKNTKIRQGGRHADNHLSLLYAILGVVLVFGALFYFSANTSFIENMASQTRQFKKNDAFTLLNTDNHELLEQSFWELEQLGEYAVPRIARIIEDKGTGEKELVNAIYAMGRLRENGASGIQALLPLLRSDNYLIRGTAVRSLGKIKEASSVYTIGPLLNDRDKWVAEGAEIALKSIGNSDARAMLKQHYAEHKK